MDSLFAKANALRPAKRRRPNASASGRPPSKRGETTTPRGVKTSTSVSEHTSLPRSLRDKQPLPDGVPTHGHIANKKLRSQLGRESAHAARTKALAKDAELLLEADAGTMQAEGLLERTWRVSQAEVTESAGVDASRGRREWKLDGGPYRCRYTRNGRYVKLDSYQLLPKRGYTDGVSCRRHLAIVGKLGHVATFDWQAGTLHTELQLQETCRDIT
jgi:U3 small nucleolar RNA-associated protein 7